MYVHYLEKIRSALGYFATWLPNAPLELGAVGTVEKGGHFRYATSLGALLGAQPPSSAGVAKGPLKYHSEQGVDVHFKLAGSPPPPNSILTIDEAGVAIEFSRENAIVFEAMDCTVDRFTDIEDIGIQLVQQSDARLWRKEYIVITEVVRAARATVLMSGGKTAHFDASFSVGVAPSGTVPLADGTLGLTVKRTQSVGIEIVAAGPLTPLFSAWHIKPHWLRDNKWESIRSVASPLEEVDLNDMLARASVPGETSGVAPADGSALPRVEGA